MWLLFSENATVVISLCIFLPPLPLLRRGDVLPVTVGIAAFVITWVHFFRCFAIILAGYWPLIQENKWQKRRDYFLELGIERHIYPSSQQARFFFPLQIPKARWQSNYDATAFYVVLYWWEIFRQPKCRATVNDHIMNSASFKPGLTYWK